MGKGLWWDYYMKKWMRIGDKNTFKSQQISRDVQWETISPD